MKNKKALKDEISFDEKGSHSLIHKDRRISEKQWENENQRELNGKKRRLPVWIKEQTVQYEDELRSL